MKSIKRGIAILMAVLLCIPTVPVSAAGGTAGAAEDIRLNLGSYEWRLMSQDTYDRLYAELKQEAEKSGDKSVLAEADHWTPIDGWDDDSDFTIPVEKNAFFPYEVQFTYNGTVTEEWFLTPDDTVTIGGHEFSVESETDGTAVTQMSLDVAGDTVIVYPEKKEFTNDGDGAAEYSLLPLETDKLTVDLSGYSPLDLSRVAISSLFTGENQLEDVSAVMWTKYVDDYTVSLPGDCLDLNDNSSSSTYTMIVGTADQLDATNTKYTVKITKSSDLNEWLIPTVYLQNEQGERSQCTICEDFTHYYFYNYYWNTNKIDDYIILVPYKENYYQEYISLTVNNAYFSGTKVKDVKAFKGMYNPFVDTAPEEITSQVLCASDSMNNVGAGYLLGQCDEADSITIVGYDEQKKVVGYRSFFIGLSTMGNWVAWSGFQTCDGSEKFVDYDVDDDYYYLYDEGITPIVHILYKGYPANAIYRQKCSYYYQGDVDNSKVTAVYIGNYNTIAEAAGQENIKESLFGDGYEADYSDGIIFSFFVQDDIGAQKVSKCYLKTEEGDYDPDSSIETSASVIFTGLYGQDGNEVNAYVCGHDSYAGGTYVTILTDEKDLTVLAPSFQTSYNATLYTKDGITPEVSETSVHDFSKGPVQYTVLAEDGTHKRNYWVSVLNHQSVDTTNTGALYITSLADEDAKTTKDESGVVRSVREVILDDYQGTQHDILLVNIGGTELPKLSAKLDSDVVKLDEYWTLKDTNSLDAFPTTGSAISVETVSNLAMLRIKAKDDVESGTEISGTLTIQSGDTTLMVLTLTGVVGDPSITTKQEDLDKLPAVKYVPYGFVIQDSNKYDWNTPTYSLEEGTLPKGIRLLPNGQLYGVPKETGTFTFTVWMENNITSYDQGVYEFSDSVREFTLTVLDNTDENVAAATDEGYAFKEAVPDITWSTTGDEIIESNGALGEFVALYLDGEPLDDSDYDKTEGSTVITISAQTLAEKSQTSGSHTLALEFHKNNDKKQVKKVAQNFELTDSSSSGSSYTPTNTPGSNNSSNTQEQPSKDIVTVEPEEKKDSLADYTTKPKRKSNAKISAEILKWLLEKRISAGNKESLREVLIRLLGNLLSEL